MRCLTESAESRRTLKGVFVIKIFLIDAAPYGIYFIIKHQIWPKGDWGAGIGRGLSGAIVGIGRY
ncbi:MAG TPA: hypothetical protein PLE88_09770, partial [Anaerohalosphaeraceae bacterium]|nr:hypothetical protein [Anaerohalosphaeraceae bacterium]